MIVNVEIKSGREYVKRAMIATMGITKLSNPEVYEKMTSTPLTDKTFRMLLIALHSPIEEYEIWVDAIVQERVHTHVVRHKELGKYVATSRPDIKYCTKLEEGQRILSLRFNAKRIIEVCKDRLCGRAWSETIDLFEEIKRQLISIEPCFRGLLSAKCAWLGFCPERCCGYIGRGPYVEERRALVQWRDYYRTGVNDG